MPAEAARLSITGCNHHQTPFEIRERLALSPQQSLTILKQLRAHPDVHECAVLCTCNRLEVYAVHSVRDWNGLLREVLGSLGTFPCEAFLGRAYQHLNLDAIRHAFKVAAGLDSQMVGETQILGQMKVSYAEAIAHQSIGPLLHRFFQKAFQAAKWARSETKIGTGQVSLGNVAVELACRIFGRLTVSRTLVIGSGEAGRDVARAFRSRGVACMSIASRTAERASALAHEVDGLIIPFANWQDSLPYTDIGIFATSAPSAILTRDVLETRFAKRLTKPLFLIDLAVPRDIDPTIADLPNVYLYNLDDLALIANENLHSREQEINACLAELDRRALLLLRKLSL
jgi:glutamyl-tRNA reductase